MRSRTGSGTPPFEVLEGRYYAALWSICAPRERIALLAALWRDEGDKEFTLTCRLERPPHGKARKLVHDMELGGDEAIALTVANGICERLVAGLRVTRETKEPKSASVDVVLKCFMELDGAHLCPWGN